MFNDSYDPLSGDQWYRDQLGVNDLGGEFSGAGILVGVVDDGIDYGHVDLYENLNFELDFDAQFPSSDAAWHRSTQLMDCHPTLTAPVAGIIVATQNNETGIVRFSARC